MTAWVVTCSCGWTSEFSQRWAAESVAKLYRKLGEAGIADEMMRTPRND